MRRLFLIALIAVIGLLPVTASAQAPAQVPTAAKSDHVYPLVLAAGATAGIMFVNWLSSGGIGTLPYSLSVAGGTRLAGPASQAVSRIYVITSGVLGAWLADVLYSR